MTDLNTQYLDASSRLLDAGQFDLVATSVAFPKPSVSDMKRYGFETGAYNPQDADDLARMIGHFIQSGSAQPFLDSHRPKSRYLHPCAPEGRQRSLEIADTLSSAGLALSYVQGHPDVPASSGFMLTVEGGRDLSKDIATAYLLCGYVPPYQPLLKALKVQDDDHMRPLFSHAARKASEHFESLADQFAEFVDPELQSRMAP